MKIKFGSGDNFPLGKALEMLDVVIVIKCFLIITINITLKYF